MTFVDRPCPKCNFNQPRRLPRNSWIERRLLPSLGVYPWECPLCRIHFYRKNRIDHDQRMRPQEPRDFASQELAQ